MQEKARLLAENGRPECYEAAFECLQTAQELLEHLAPSKSKIRSEYFIQYCASWAHNRSEILSLTERVRQKVSAITSMESILKANNVDTYDCRLDSKLVDTMVKVQPLVTLQKAIDPVDSLSELCASTYAPSNSLKQQKFFATATGDETLETLEAYDAENHAGVKKPSKMTVLRNGTVASQFCKERKQRKPSYCQLSLLRLLKK